jgi:hypothetical protein
MRCYECSRTGRPQEAVAVCHHCSAALCVEHSRIVAEPIAAAYPVLKSVVLPRRARVFLCQTCLAALEQNRSEAGRRKAAESPAAVPAL